jgi:uncharacterized protein YdhG (YjbR/CyaY superfamily)
VSSHEVDDYLVQLESSDRDCLAALRTMIGLIIPEAEECISYRVPVFRIGGVVVAGFAAFKTHLSYLPFSGSVLSTLDGELGGRSRTKSSLHFTAEEPLPRGLVEKLIQARRDEIARRGR